MPDGPIGPSGLAAWTWYNAGHRGERGLAAPGLEELKMATVSTEKRTIDVTLYRPGTDMQTFTLLEGATLADLLREAGVEARNSGLLIDGRSIEAVITLLPGMMITILPEP